MSSQEVYGWCCLLINIWYPPLYCDFMLSFSISKGCHHGYLLCAALMEKNVRYTCHIFALGLQRVETPTTV